MKSTNNVNQPPNLLGFQYHGRLLCIRPEKGKPDRSKTSKRQRQSDKITLVVTDHMKFLQINSMLQRQKRPIKGNYSRSTDLQKVIMPLQADFGMKMTP